MTLGHFRRNFGPGDGGDSDVRDGECGADGRRAPVTFGARLAAALTANVARGTGGAAVAELASGAWLQLSRGPTGAGCEVDRDPPGCIPGRAHPSDLRSAARAEEARLYTPRLTPHQRGTRRLICRSGRASALSRGYRPACAGASAACPWRCSGHKNSASKSAKTIGK